MDRGASKPVLPTNPPAKQAGADVGRTAAGGESIFGNGVGEAARHPRIGECGPRIRTSDSGLGVLVVLPFTGQPDR